jgi:hypothetical protein
MNKDNLYDNTLKDLVKYYTECVRSYDLPPNMVGGKVHSPSDVMEVILDKFDSKVR